MKLQIELDDGMLADAVSAHLLSKDCVRDAVAKAFNRAAFVEQFSAWIAEEMPAVLKEALSQEATKQAMVEAIKDASELMAEKIRPELFKLREEVAKLSMTKNDGMHPALAKRIR